MKYSLKNKTISLKIFLPLVDASRMKDMARISDKMAVHQQEELDGQKLKRI